MIALFNSFKKLPYHYYVKTLGLKEALYLVFVPNTVNLPGIREQEETVAGILISTYIVQYDEEKDF